jgi:hypothetical protein
MALNEIALAAITGVEPGYFLGIEPCIEKPEGTGGAFQQFAKKWRPFHSIVRQEWCNDGPSSLRLFG